MDVINIARGMQQRELKEIREFSFGCPIRHGAAESVSCVSGQHF
jgi:hypothetical protein